MKIAAVVLGISMGLFYMDDIKAYYDKEGKGKHAKHEKKEKKGKKDHDLAGAGFVAGSDGVIKGWELPETLREVSGIAYMDAERFACVQDEAGTVYVYNTRTSRIEKEIPFAGPGDFEGLTIAGDNMYIMRSDGRLYELNNVKNNKPVVKEYDTPFGADNNVEGLCYDKDHNRLLLAVKGDDLHSTDKKGIYSFDLAAHKVRETPVFNISLEDPALELSNNTKKKTKSPLQPSAIGIHPITKAYYITDAANGRLMVLNPQGKIVSVTPLNKNVFYKPEGISFSPDGKVFISNEGKKLAGNILNVSY